MIVIFCLLLRTGSMIREAVPDNITYFLVAPLLAFPLRKPRIVALYLLSFGTLALVGAFWERLSFILKIR